MVAPWGFLIANFGYAWATRHGGSDATGKEALELAAAHGGVLHVTLQAAMLGSLLLIPGVVGAMRLMRNGAPRLSLVGGSMMIAGYASYMAILTPSFTTLAMAEHGGPMADFAAVTDAAQAPSTAWVFVLFVLGNLVGTFLLGLALWRSRVVPVWAACGVLAWPPLHVIGLVAGSEWFEVTGAALQAVGLFVVGRRVLVLDR
jgi:hypothetical protein